MKRYGANGLSADSTGTWLFSVEHAQPCRIIDTEQLWGDTIYRVWFPETASVVRLQDKLEQKTHAFREMVPLVMIRVEGGRHE